MAYPQPTVDPTAVMGRRIGAILIDLVIMGTLVGLVVVPTFLSSAETRTWPTAQAAEDHCNAINDRLSDRISESDSSEFSFQAGDRFCGVSEVTTYELEPTELEQFVWAFYGSMFVVVALNWILLQGLLGASVGKLMVGLHVVREDGQKAGFGWILLREVLLVVDLVCCFVIGLVTASSSKGHRRVGDMAASTYVVAKSSVGTPPLSGDAGGYPGGYPGFAGQPPAAPGWGPTPTSGATSWGAPPPASGPASWGGPAGPTTTPGADGPTWDSARNAYIQYDRDQGQWIQWNDQAQAWGPIDQ